MKGAYDDAYATACDLQKQTGATFIHPFNDPEVIAVGPGYTAEGKEVKMEVKPGDRVLYTQYAGTKAKLDGVEYIIVSMGDIKAIVEE